MLPLRSLLANNIPEAAEGRDLGILELLVSHLVHINTRKSPSIDERYPRRR